MERVLVTGANRGIGLEFARQYLQRGSRVFAGYRRPDAAQHLESLKESHPDQLTILPLDVADADSIRASQQRVRTQVDSLDVLINNAGIGVAEHLGALNFDDVLRVMRVNAVGPLLIAQEYLDLLRAGENAKIANVTSGYGSVSQNSGFPYSYSASKAALHQLMRSLAAEIRQWGIMTVLLDPGWVQTDMGGPNAPLPVEQSAGGMIKVIDALTPERSGAFINWQGSEMQW